MNDAFLSPASFQGGKTMTYIEEYCSWEWLRKGDSESVVLPCMDLIYVYSKMYILRNVQFTRFIALFQTSPLSRLTDANLAVRDLREAIQ